MQSIMKDEIYEFSRYGCNIYGCGIGNGLLFAESFAELCGNVVMCNANEEILAERVAASDKGQFINGENIMIYCGRNAMRRGQYE